MSALECVGLFDAWEEDVLTHDEEILVLSLQRDRNKLVVSATTQEPITRALNELSNAEDESARWLGRKDEMGRLAARASRALSALYLKVLRMKL